MGQDALEFFFNAEYNGLAKSGAVLRVGRKVLIDPTQFMAWMRTNTRTSPPGAKPARPRPVAILEGEVA